MEGKEGDREDRRAWRGLAILLLSLEAWTHLSPGPPGPGDSGTGGPGWGKLGSRTGPQTPVLPQVHSQVVRPKPSHEAFALGDRSCPNPPPFSLPFSRGLTRLGE